MASGSKAKSKLLDAALHLIRAQGYAGTSVEDICRLAGVTKGSFFHHFKGKEDLALATVQHFNGFADLLFHPDGHRALPTPQARVLGYVDARVRLMAGEIPDISCLLGTLLQETYSTHPALREAAGSSIEAHAAQLVPDLQAALDAAPQPSGVSPEELALFMQAVMQGAFVLAKAQADPAIARACVGHLKRYLTQLMGVPPEAAP